jgi:hypothetical protein
LREVESGNRAQARSEANAALKLAPNRDVQTKAAFAIARAGDTAAAEKLAANLDKPYPLGHSGAEILAAHDSGGGRFGAPRPKQGHRIIEGSKCD